MNNFYKNRLFDIIVSGKDIQYTMDACAELIGNPLVFFNQSLQIIAKSASCSQFPKLFFWIEDVMGTGLQYVHEATEAGYFNAIYANDKPVPGKLSGISSNWLAARVRFGHQVIGSILTADCMNPFPAEYNETLPLVCQAISFVMQQPMIKDYRMSNFGPLMIRLLDGDTDNHMTDETTRNYFKLIHETIPNKFRILVLRPHNSKHVVNLGFLDAQLHSQFPTSIGVIYKNECVRIIDGSSSISAIEERLKKYVYMPYVSCGVSRIFHSLTDIHDAYLQADAAIRLTRTKKTEKVNCFDKVIGSYLLEQTRIAGNISVKGIIMSEIFELEKTKEGNEKVQDLAAFLSCGRSVTRTAQLRKVHKNSMYYRLNQIMDYTGLDLYDDSTCLNLTVALFLLGYLPL